MRTRLKKGDNVPFTQISNDILFSQELSLKAKGLYCFMYAKPDDWYFKNELMAEQLKEGCKSIASGIRELIEFGLLEYKKFASGKIEYTIYSTIKKPKVQNGSLDKSQKSKTADSQNGRQPKQQSINNKDTNTNKDLNKNTLAKNEEREISFKSFRFQFIKANREKMFTLADCKPWKSDTVFQVGANGYLLNCTSQEYLNNKDAFKVWNYLYNKHLNGSNFI